MILFNNTTTIQGQTQFESLAYVKSCTIDETRTHMSVEVTISCKNQEPNYDPYTSPWICNNIPYDPNSDISPSTQAYIYLMANDSRFEGGTQYPPYV